MSAAWFSFLRVNGYALLSFTLGKKLPCIFKVENTVTSLGRFYYRIVNYAHISKLFPRNIPYINI